MSSAKAATHPQNRIWLGLLIETLRQTRECLRNGPYSLYKCAFRMTKSGCRLTKNHRFLSIILADETTFAFQTYFKIS